MATDERVNRLEREVRLLRWIVITFGGVILLITASGQAKEPELQDLVGKTLTLRTEDGRTWLTAGPKATGGEMRLYCWQPTAGPTPGLTLLAEREQKYFGILDGQEFPLANLGVSDQRPSLMLVRKNMELSAIVGEHVDKHGCVVVYGKDEKILSVMPENTRIQPRPGEGPPPEKDE